MVLVLQNPIVIFRLGNLKQTSFFRSQRESAVVRKKRLLKANLSMCSSITEKVDKAPQKVTFPIMVWSWFLPTWSLDILFLSSSSSSSFWYGNQLFWSYSCMIFLLFVLLLLFLIESSHSNLEFFFDKICVIKGSSKEFVIDACSKDTT